MDITETGLGMIKEEAKIRSLTNMKPVLATPINPNLPEPVGLAFKCDTDHHMSDRVAYFRSLAGHLHENGRVATLDDHKTGLFSGFLGHEAPKELVRYEMKQVGYRLVEEHSLLQNQPFQICAVNPP